MLVVSVLYYYRAMTMIHATGIIAASITMCTLIKYVVTFVPTLFAKPRARTQLLVFWGSYLFISVLYLLDLISTFELMLCGVYISWDWNGQIVTHDVLKENLPIYTPYYWLTAGVILEYYYFNPLVWMVDSKNNIHLTTLGMWLVLGFKNWSHQRLMSSKIISKSKGKGKGTKKKKHQNGKVKHED